MKVLAYSTAPPFLHLGIFDDQRLLLVYFLFQTDNVADY